MATIQKANNTFSIYLPTSQLEKLGWKKGDKIKCIANVEGKEMVLSLIANEGMTDVIQSGDNEIGKLIGEE